MIDDTSESPFPASIIKIIDDFNVVINLGSIHGIEKGDTFLVYFTDPEELTDPETGESLGCLEIVRGTAVATHVQEKITTLKSNRYVHKGRTIRRQNRAFSIIGSETVEEEGEKELVAFDQITIKDKVKPTY